MKFKVIVYGKLEYKNERSLGKALNTFLHQNEVLFRNQILFKAEDIFVEEENSLYIKRMVKEGVNKRWIRNTVSILENTANFAMSGDIGFWQISEEREITDYYIEPNNDKSAVLAFKQGCQTLKEGSVDEAITALDKAIKKFDRHASAYERRAYANYQLENYEEALTDYNKSISINPSNPSALYGRAIIHLTNDKVEEAVEDLAKATKTSIALQPIYWKSRRLKGNCHLRLGQYEQAAFEYKLFTKQNFGEDDPNLPALKNAFFNFGKVLLKVGKPTEALDAFNKAKSMNQVADSNTFSLEEWKEYHQIASAAVA